MRLRQWLIGLWMVRETHHKTLISITQTQQAKYLVVAYIHVFNSKQLIDEFIHLGDYYSK
jgi:hypothetical protein